MSQVKHSLGDGPLVLFSDPGPRFGKHPAQQNNKLNSQIITGLNTNDPFALSTIISSESVASGKQPGIYRDSVVFPRIQSMLDLGAFDSNIDEVEQQILGQTLVLGDGNEVTVAQLAENGNAQALQL